MANFIDAYNTTAGHEGGYTVDNGGETYKGISRKGWPGWEGWKLIDALKKRFGTPKRNSYFNSSQLDELVTAFYKKNYWDKMAGDYIRNQTIANFIFDFYFNSNSALMQINRAIGARAGSTINEDSLKIINERPAFAYQAIFNSRKNHISRLSKKPALKKYEKGWTARLNKFPLPVNVTA